MVGAIKMVSGGVNALPAIIFAVVLSAIMTPAVAHRVPEAITKIVHAEEAGEPVTYITHSFHTHDALKLISMAKEVEGPTLTSAVNQAWVEDYVAAGFEMDGPTKVLGSEVDGNITYVYEVAKGHRAAIAGGLLSELGSEWRHLVTTTTADGSLTSVTFSAPNGRRIPSR